MLEAIYDVCIVGSGPAGATAARNLEARGRKVIVLEKNEGAYVDAIAIEPASWEVIVGARSYRAKTLIAADGAPSHVAHILGISTPPRRLAFDRLLIVGDAAGQRGVHDAIQSGALAAEVLDRALAAEDTSQRFLARYERMLSDQS